MSTASGKKAYEAAGLKDPVHLPDHALPAGDYTWDVEALNSAGKMLARRGAWKFRVPKGLVELPWRDPKSLPASVKKSTVCLYYAGVSPASCWSRCSSVFMRSTTFLYAGSL